MLVRRAWMIGLCACSVFPDRAVLPPDDGMPSGGIAGVGGFTGSGGELGGTGGGLASGGREGANGGGAGVVEGLAGSGGSGGAGAPACDGAEVTTVTADADTWLSELQPSENQGDALSLEVGTMSGDHAHALVDFPIPQLPANHVLASARLEVELRTSPGETRSLVVHRVLQAWREGQATWSKARTGNNEWLTPGGDVNPNPTERVELHAGASVGARVTFDVTSDVLDLIAEPTKNFGWMIRHEEEGASRVELGARELGTERPALILTSCP